MENEKLIISRAIVVEGKYDLKKLESVTDAVIIKTDGFGIFRNDNTKQLIRRYAVSSGLIILTDSDSAGRIIRNRIKGMCGKCDIINLYVPQVKGTEKRKKTPSKEGYLGVEGFRPELLRELLLPYSENGGEECKRPGFLTRAVLYEDGLMGGDDSKIMRKKLLTELDLPDNLSVTELTKASGRLFSREEYLSALRKTEE